MKITCPKCHSSYKVNLPDPGEAGIDVQCGKCFYIFLFSTDTQKPVPSEKPKHTLEQSHDSSLSAEDSSEPILPPQKDEDQEVSDSQEQPLQSQKQPKKDQEASEELELEPISDDSEPIEIIVEDDDPEESLEEVALDDIWNQAVEEGARTVADSKKKSPSLPSSQPVSETESKESAQETSPPSEKKSKRLPSLEDRQREIDQMIAEHQSKQKESEEKVPAEEIKAQEEIDLEEQVIVDEGEAMPNWDEAFLHQAEVEEGWKKAQEQDRILEEQQLADALGKSIPSEPSNEEASAEGPQEDKQSLVDQIFAETKSSQEPEKETAQSSPPESPADQKQKEVDQIFTEAKSQEEIDLGEQVVINEGETMPSWEEAFADQSTVESGWKKSMEEDRIHEEQQLADALGEEYISPESTDEETPAPAAEESKQDLVNQLFEEVRSQQESSESTELSEEDASSSEIQETHVGEHTIPGEIDLMTDLDDLNMKQMVTQAFKEESESQEETRQPTLEAGTHEEEAAQEPEMTMESMAETLLSPESAPEETVAAPEMEAVSEPTFESSEEEPESAETIEEGSEMEAISELTLESAEEESEPVEAVSQEESELESIENLTLESAEEESEPVEAVSQEESGLESIENLTLESEEEEPESAGTIAQDEDSEMESISELTLESMAEELDPVEAVIQEEAAGVETVDELEPLLETDEFLEESDFGEPPLEMEPEPELTMESKEENEVSEEQLTMSQKSFLEEEEEQIWNDLLAEHGEEEQPAVVAETPTTSAQEEEDDAFEENDFWDQVLEKDSEELPTTESEPQPVAASSVPSTTERETLTDEELWKQAFPGEEDLEPAPAKHFDTAEEDLQSEPAPLVIEASATPEESEGSLDYDEAAYADYGEDDDEFEFERRKRKLGPFVIPHGRRGDLVIGGVMVVFLLLAGSVYFTLQTFAPGELTEMQTAQNEVPEGLTPREVPLDELAGDLISPKPRKTLPVDTPGDKGEAILSDPADILKESQEEKSILKDLAESQILKDTGKSQTAKIDQSALQALSGHSVTMSTIMPVAYNPTDIRVLSFSVEIQLSNSQSAKRVRESLPVYEELMNQTVEEFLRRKFYNDILYVKEKLQKRLQTAMNQSLKNGRVKKAKFTDFAIQ